MNIEGIKEINLNIQNERVRAEVKKLSKELQFAQQVHSSNSSNVTNLLLHHTDDEKHEYRLLIQRYIENEIDSMSVENVRQMDGLFWTFKVLIQEQHQVLSTL